MVKQSKPEEEEDEKEEEEAEAANTGPVLFVLFYFFPEAFGAYLRERKSSVGSELKQSRPGASLPGSEPVVHIICPRHPGFNRTGALGRVHNLSFSPPLMHPTAGLL